MVFYVEFSVKYLGKKRGVNMSFDEFLKFLFRRAFPIFLATLICGFGAWGVSSFFLPDTYETSIVLCIRNRQDDAAGIAGSDLTASELLTDPCISLLKRSAAQDVTLSFEKYGAGVFEIRLHGGNIEVLTNAAETLSDMACHRLPQLVGAASVSVIERTAVVDRPRKTLRNTVVGAVLGFAFSASALLFLESCSRRDEKKKEPG